MAFVISGYLAYRPNSNSWSIVSSPVLSIVFTSLHVDASYKTI